MRCRYQICLIITVVLGVYYPALFAPLNSVDDPGLYSYLLNTDDFNLRNIFLPGGSGSYYRPLLLASFLIDKYVWGLEESFMHLNNIIIHLANTLLVYALARRATQCLPEPSPAAPFVAALFFAIHPLNAEAVNWISGRTDLLAGLFLLSALYLFLRQSLTWVHSLTAALCMLLACLVKETAIFFLPAALLFPFFISTARTDTAPLCSVFRSYWLHFIIFCSAGSAYFFFRILAFSKGDDGVARVIAHVGGSKSAGVLINAKLVLKAIGFYAKKLLIPFPLNFGIIHVSDAYLPLGVLVLAGILWLISRRTLPAFFVICAGAVGTSALMIPMLGLTWTPLAERYMYIPSAFFLVGVTLAVQQWELRSKYRVQLVIVVSCLAVIALYGTITRTILWQDNLALFQDTLRKSPDFMPAQNEIATALKKKGRLTEALEILKKMEKKDELVNYQYGLINKAGALADNGDYDTARHILRDILKDPGRHESLVLEKLLEVNKIQLFSGKTTSAAVYADTVTCLTRLYEITGNPFYQYRLGVVHLHEKNNALALQSFTIVTKIAPPAIYYRKPAEKLAKDLAK
jgi:tetratricopeptide (TPR) repeat protein